MAGNFVLGLAAAMALVPASLLPYRRPGHRPDLLYWAVLGAAVAGPVALSLVHFADAWRTGLSDALWVSIAASLIIYALLAALAREAWRLTPLLLPYLCALALLAVIWGQQPDPGPPAAAPDLWLLLHIAVSVATYALATIAAVAGVAVVVQERALRRKESGILSRQLPAIADAEALEIRLLGAAELVLGVGVATGMALQYFRDGSLLAVDHKTVLSLLAFLVIGLLLILHQRTGLRGQRAARWMLVAYLLLTLAYPGVKFVTDVLIA